MSNRDGAVAKTDAPIFLHHYTAVGRYLFIANMADFCDFRVFCTINYAVFGVFFFDFWNSRKPAESVGLRGLKSVEKNQGF